MAFSLELKVRNVDSSGGQLSCGIEEAIIPAAAKGQHPYRGYTQSQRLELTLTRISGLIEREIADTMTRLAYYVQAYEQMHHARDDYPASNKSDVLKERRDELRPS
ncbi:hypothetical protein VNI00_015709 [Paramarasmius palmivorus]|uniref:Uncharacterized protein n=1 Tax=Paramarasmius palmivorus TaxID=297713 RepID=A0AAW0BJ43_9AGAR